MYQPAHFQETRLPVLHDLIRAYPLATLVTLDTSGLVANLIPMEIDASVGELGVLRGHVARGNPVWKSHRAEVEAMALFAGPHDYITPSYYATKAETGKVVPTWNYATVHAYGPLRAIDDPAWLRAFLEQLTHRHEAELPAHQPRWQVSDAPASYIDGLLQAIVGIEIPITRFEGKWKVSQNRSVADRAGVAAGLAER
ncbi:MAG: FMN-binding negative transcriptional regulator, partial [Deltaproteobacteria bacterium]|nr:FMN-binding negative transcriptional regulator [Nannocystaceae bacterium]